MPGLTVDPLRHQSIFDPDLWGDRLVDVVGLGATGSRIAMGLAKLGIRRIRGWDPDVIEPHNVANQLFGVADIGKSKAEVVRARVLADTGIELDAKVTKVTGSEKLGHVVFLLTDDMESRRQIFSKGIKLKLGVKLLIETRLGVDHGRVYVINPLSPGQVREYEKTLISAAPIETSACGTAITIGQTAEFLSALAAHQLIRAFAVEQGSKEDELDSEIIFCLRPPHFERRTFK